MKNRRRKGVSAAGVVAVVLLAAPTSAAPGRLAADPSDAPADAAPSVDVPAPRSPARTPIWVQVAEVRAAPPAAPAPEVFCPVAGPVELTDSWGFRRSGGRRHEGVDLLAAEGTPVVAPVDGEVTTRTNRTGGLSYHLTAADGTYYYGTHLAAYGATGTVAAGTVIGYVGDTGNARGTPHLHFEIHPGGDEAAAVNPYPTVAAWCTVERIEVPEA